MKNDTLQQASQQQEHDRPAKPQGRLLGRRLARELTRDEIDAISGGMRKAPTHDNGGTGSGLWGNLDD